MTKVSPLPDAPTRVGRERRRVLLGAAIDSIAQEGFVGASLSKVAQAAGVEKGHVTYYFKTKDDLLFEIIHDVHQRFLDAWDDWVSDPDLDPAELLLTVFENHVRLVCELYKQTRVSYESMRFLTSQRRALVESQRSAYELRFRAAIDDAREVMPIADISTNFLTKSVLGLLNWPYQWYSPTGPGSAEDIARLLAGRAMAALRPSGDHLAPFASPTDRG